MKRPFFFILLSLAGQDRHGSAIMRDVLELTDGDVRLWPATLYGALDELLAEGWIEELADPQERPDESDRLRIYRLTASGKRVLQEETQRLEGLARTARLRVAGARSQ